MQVKMDKTRLFNLDFYNKDLKSIKLDLESDITENKKVSIYTPNVDHIINIKSDDRVYQKYSQGDYIIADGWPVAMASKIKDIPVHKITGVDLMDELLQISKKNKLNLFFLGATDDTLIKLKKNIEKKFAGVGNISYHDGYFKEAENDAVIEKINKSGASILFVGMGSPKQELWITENIDKLNINIAVAIGGALKIYSEEISRAPKWIQKIGMEWFYRFLKEPTRLFNRYFIKYPKFLKYLYYEIRGNKR